MALSRTPYKPRKDSLRTAGNTLAPPINEGANITMVKEFMPLVLGLTLLSSPVFAAKPPHHCVDKDNKEISLTAAPGKTLAAQCKAAGGKWVRMKAAKTTTTPATPATPTTPKK
jgi:hypothetical protein